MFIHILLKILLSAILFNLSFFCPDNFGFLSVFSFITVFLIFKKISLKYCLVAGFLYGIFTFSFHFIWLYELLLNRSNATFFLSTNIYLFIIFYASLISCIWFLITYFLFKFEQYFNLNKIMSFFIKISFFLLSTYIYFLFIGNYSLWFLERIEGYPFLNPFITFARYKWFLFFCSLIFFNHMNDFNFFESKDFKVFYLKPVNSFNKKINPSVVGQEIFYKLTNLNLDEYSDKYKNLIIVAPETTYPFSLNKHTESLSLWGCVLPKNANFLIGSQKEENGNAWQSVYWIRASRIIQNYDKKHIVPFTEKIPTNWKSFNWANKLFLKNKKEFVNCNNTLNEEIFKIDDFYIFPKICSEFFMVNDCSNNLFKYDKKVIFLFVNDSWFMEYFKKIMKNFVYLKRTFIGVPILYITHQKCLKM